MGNHPSRSRRAQQNLPQPPQQQQQQARRNPDPRAAPLAPSQQIPASPYIMFGGPSVVPGNQRMPHQPIIYYPRPQAPPPPQVTQTITLKNDVNLKKSSMKLTGVEGSGTRFKLSFTVDLTADCWVKVLYAATEVTDAEGIVNFTTPSAAEYAMPPVMLTKGIGQNFSQSNEQCLDITRLPPSLRDAPAPPNSTFPIVVVLEAIPTEGASSSTTTTATSTSTKHAQCQFTYATIVRSAGDGGPTAYQVKALKQSVQVNSQTYELQEIYGIENQAPTDTDQVVDSMCVICMSDTRDTTVLPCRHMCLCSECAKALRTQTNKCPICRTVIESLLQIKVSKQEDKTPPPPPAPPAPTSASSGGEGTA